MRVLEVRNVHQALPQGIRLLLERGEEEDSRNGKVLVHPGPVTTRFSNPDERVEFHIERDSNPFFHFYESLWMLAGRNDVAPLASIVKRMQTFSDDGQTLHGAYGHRWRVHFGFDQLGHIIEELKANKQSRRCVLQMWDSTIDLGRDGKDLPCNTAAYLWVRNDQLDMTVLCRSNDMIWGAYGANAVHFSMLQEYIATGVGVSIGTYWQVSNNYHAYLNTFDPLRDMSGQAPDGFKEARCPYSDGQVQPYRLINTDVATWTKDLQMFLTEGLVIGFRDSFFRRVANPIMKAHEAYKSHDGLDKFYQPLEILENCRASDWRAACEEWIKRRYDTWTEKNEHE